MARLLVTLAFLLGLTACDSPTAPVASSCWFRDTVQFNDATTHLPETVVVGAHRDGCH